MKTILSDKVYDILKWLCIIGLPAFEKFIPSFFNRWGIPYGEQISGSLNDIEVLIGALICVSAVAYEKVKTEILNINNYSVDEVGKDG